MNALLSYFRSNMDHFIGIAGLLLAVVMIPTIRDNISHPIKSYRRWRLDRLEWKIKVIEAINESTIVGCCLALRVLPRTIKILFAAGWITFVLLPLEQNQIVDFALHWLWTLVCLDGWRTWSILGRTSDKEVARMKARVQLLILQLGEDRGSLIL